ncbi:MAG: hypothetical protein U0531_01980, partial [Dehalococcoidia bacterium]
QPVATLHQAAGPLEIALDPEIRRTLETYQRVVTKLPVSPSYTEVRPKLDDFPVAFFDELCRRKAQDVEPMIGGLHLLRKACSFVVVNRMDFDAIRVEVAREMDELFGALVALFLDFTGIVQGLLQANLTMRTGWVHALTQGFQAPRWWFFARWWRSLALWIPRKIVSGLTGLATVSESLFNWMMTSGAKVFRSAPASTWRVSPPRITAAVAGGQQTAVEVARTLPPGLDSAARETLQRLIDVAAALVSALMALAQAGLYIVRQFCYLAAFLLITAAWASIKLLSWAGTNAAPGFKEVYVALWRDSYLRTASGSGWTSDWMESRLGELAQSMNAALGRWFSGAESTGGGRASLAQTLMDALPDRDTYDAVAAAALAAAHRRSLEGQTPDGWRSCLTAAEALHAKTRADYQTWAGAVAETEQVVAGAQLVLRFAQFAGWIPATARQMTNVIGKWLYGEGAAHLLFGRIQAYGLRLTDVADKLSSAIEGTMRAVMLGTQVGYLYQTLPFTAYLIETLYVAPAPQQPNE